MFVRGLLGNKSNEELEKGYEYLEKSYKLGNVAASNLIGNMYLNGIYPLNRDVEKAKEYYKKASDNNYAYAFNNLGRIEEDNKNYIEAFNYYLQSANLGESWACNKVAEAYRIGLVDKDMDKAYSTLKTGYEKVRLEEGYIRVYDIESPEEIVEFLLKNNQTVCEIKKNRVGLEEYYIELMSQKEE
jgi:tetratricopeptide (TPR) repeat protein